MINTYLPALTVNSPYSHSQKNHAIQNNSSVQNERKDIFNGSRRHSSLTAKSTGKNIHKNNLKFGEAKNKKKDWINEKALPSLYVQPLRAAELDTWRWLLSAMHDPNVAPVREEDSPLVEIDLATGVPRLDTHTGILQALVSAIQKSGSSAYVTDTDDRQVEDAVIQYMQKEYGVTVGHENIAILPGVESVLHTLFKEVLKPGTIITSAPAYPGFERALVGTEWNHVRVPLVKNSAFVSPGSFFKYPPILPDFEKFYEAIEKRGVDNVKAISLIFPHNPTGLTVTRKYFQQVVDTAAKHGILVINDMSINTGKNKISILNAKNALNQAIEVHNITKSTLVPGWRIAFAVGTPEVIAPLKKVLANRAAADIPRFIQQAYIYILSNPQAAQFRAELGEKYKENKRFMKEGLEKLGWPCQKLHLTAETPFLWVPVPVNQPSREFAKRLLEKTGVQVHAGTDFGPEGEGFVRITAGDREDLAEALRRFRKAGFIYKPAA